MKDTTIELMWPVSWALTLKERAIAIVYFHRRMMQVLDVHDWMNGHYKLVDCADLSGLETTVLKLLKKDAIAYKVDRTIPDDDFHDIGNSSELTLYARAKDFSVRYEIESAKVFSQSYGARIILKRSLVEGSYNNYADLENIVNKILPEFDCAVLQIGDASKDTCYVWKQNCIVRSIGWYNCFRSDVELPPIPNSYSVQLLENGYTLVKAMTGIMDPENQEHINKLNELGKIFEQAGALSMEFEPEKPASYLIELGKDRAESDQSQVNSPIETTIIEDNAGVTRYRKEYKLDAKMVKHVDLVVSNISDTDLHFQLKSVSSLPIEASIEIAGTALNIDPEGNIPMYEFDPTTGSHSGNVYDFDDSMYLCRIFVPDTEIGEDDFIHIEVIDKKSGNKVLLNELFIIKNQFG